MITWVLIKVISPNHELHLQSPATKSLWLYKDKLHLKNTLKTGDYDSRDYDVFEIMT